MKKKNKDKPSLVVLEDHHHYTAKGSVIKDFKTKGVDKHILVLNTDKHPHIRIVTPDVIVELRSGKGRNHSNSTSVRVIPELWNEKTRETLRISYFDDMRELNVEVEGERIKDKWTSWLDNLEE